MTIKEHSILFSTSMIQAILDGRKIQTRRIVKTPKIINQFPDLLKSVYLDGDGNWIFWSSDSNDHASFTKKAYPTGNNQGIKCPYGQAGDRLWVRESFSRGIGSMGESFVYAYRATDSEEFGPWKPSIHMPREACRVLLEITGIRVQRLQDISEEDAIAEGIDVFSYEKAGLNFEINGQCTRDPIKAFEFLWDSINAKKHPWDANHWVWVIEFKRLDMEPK